MSDTETSATPVDWRGTPIVPGALVIYGGPVGRSKELNFFAHQERRKEARRLGRVMSPGFRNFMAVTEDR